MRFHARMTLWDPGYTKLRTAVRATLAIVLSYVLAGALQRWVHASASLPFLAAMMTLISSIGIADLKKSEEKLATLLVPLPAFFAVLGAIFLTPWPTARLLAFLGVVFFAVSIRKFGTRWSGLGLTTFMAYFASLFFPFVPSDILWVAITLMLSMGLTYAARFWFLPDHSDWVLSHLIAAFELQLKRCLETMSEVLRDCRVDDGRTDHELPPHWIPLRMAFIELNDLGLRIEQFVERTEAPSLKPYAGAFQLSLFEREFDLRRVWEVLVRIVRSDPMNAELRTVIRDDIAGFLPLFDNPPGVLKESRVALLPGLDPDLIAGYLDARRTIVEHRKEPLSRNKMTQDLMQDFGDKGTAVVSVPTRGLHMSTKQAIQATVATGAASFLGNDLSPERWYWASISAFMVFVGASRGETLMRAFMRVIGTVIGLLLGYGLAFLVKGIAGLGWSIVVASIFVGIFCSRMHFGFWSATLFSTMFVLLYDRLGLLTAHVLVLRVEETLLGAAMGALVAAIVLPTSTHKMVRESLGKFLRTLALIAADLSQDVASPFGRRSTVRLLREMDKDLVALRGSAAPITGKASVMKRGGVPGIIHDSTALAHFVRHLAIRGKAPDHAIFKRICDGLIAEFLACAEYFEKAGGDRPRLEADEDAMRAVDGDTRHFRDRIRIVLLSMVNRKI